VPIRGEPHTLGLWVKGNSSWGKVMFESEDAKGGNRRTHANQYHDWRGELSINFDGWHFIQFPLDAGPPHHPRISRRTMATSEGREWQRGPPHPADDAARRVEPPGAVSAREEQFPFLRAGDRSDAARRGRPRRARFSRAAVRSLAAGAAADMIVNQLVRGRVGLGPVAVVRRPILRNLRMRTSVVKAKLARNEPVLAVTVHFTDPSVAELASLLGFDCLWLDLEHHATSLETASNLIRASRVGNADVVARPAKGEFMRMGRLLETGAAGIMYPRCESAAEAAEVVKWAKFAPLGRRGVDGGNPDMPYLTMPVADYLKAANEQTFIVMQLEDSEAVARADEIAAVPGIDVLFLGVGDFTVLSGFPGRFDHPAVDDAVRRVASAAAKAGIHWGMPCFSPEHGRRLIDLGARFLAHSADLSILKKGLEQIRVDFAPLGCRFAPACNGPGSVTV
jgi:4-hydroxy-2-oxoheptanedioate aldolase